MIQLYTIIGWLLNYTYTSFTNRWICILSRYALRLLSFDDGVYIHNINAKLKYKQKVSWLYLKTCVFEAPAGLEHPLSDQRSELLYHLWFKTEASSPKAFTTPLLSRFDSSGDLPARYGDILGLMKTLWIY